MIINQDYTYYTFLLFLKNFCFLSEYLIFPVIELLKFVFNLFSFHTFHCTDVKSKIHYVYKIPMRFFYFTIFKDHT